MKFISTRNAVIHTSFHDALLLGLAPDGGLFIPETFPHTNAINEAITISELGHIIMSQYINDIPELSLKKIIHAALNFPIPLIPLEKNLYLLEVFHGPTLAFKDVGARFMAQTLAYFLSHEKKHLTIMVATSGDTGSAIAHAFHDLPNLDVFILYPSGKVSMLQEKQMTTLGGNIHALEIEGTFDDCQRLVKQALLDPDLRNGRLLSTANSINISRLLPQMIYHSWGAIQLKQFGITEQPILSIPSGNFGNLVSALYAKSLGINIEHFIAATNINAIVPDYLKTDVFKPMPSRHTLSNAMDVGNPSNFERLLAFYDNKIDNMRQAITGTSITDEQTLHEIRDTYQRTGYLLDPHTAVGVAAARQYATTKPIIITATAHPAKFPEVIQQALDITPDMPEQLKAALERPKQSKKMNTDYETLKYILLH